MTGVKASLTVTLKANDVVVAETDDPDLWHRVLTAIRTGKVDLGEPTLPERQREQQPPPAGDPLGKLAAELGLSRDVVEGACSPSPEPPFLQLDLHNWGAMRRELPERGPTALSPIVVASTLMALWFRHAGLGNPTQAQVLAVLSAISVEDRNPSRGIRRAIWLQPRGGGQVALNAGHIADAVKIAKAFCSKTWTEWTTGSSGDE